jgi:hypothetical protein
MYEGSNKVAWLALIIAGIALWLSWTNYNRTSDVKLEDKIQEYAEEKWETLQEDKDSATSTATST